MSPPTDLVHLCHDRTHLSQIGPVGSRSNCQDLWIASSRSGSAPSVVRMRSTVAKHRARFDPEIRAYRVREICDEQVMTQKELAERMAITQPTIFALESGELAPGEGRHQLAPRRKVAR